MLAILNKWHNEYKEKGLEVIGISIGTKFDDLKEVDNYVAKKNKQFSYRFAHGDKTIREVYTDAAGEEFYPTSFVIGKDGKIAYIGYPTGLDDVLPQIVAGTWKGKESMDAINAGKAALDTLFESLGKAEQDKKFDAAFATETLKKLAEVETKHPTLVGKENVATLRLILSLKADKVADVEKAANAALAVADKKKVAPAILVAQILTDKSLNPTPTDAQKAMAMAATEKALKLGGTNVELAIRAMNVCLALDNKAKAKEAGDLAIKNAAAEGAETLKQVRMIVDKALAESKK